jgi:hypothetical protein
MALPRERWLAVGSVGSGWSGIGRSAIVGRQPVLGRYRLTDSRDGTGHLITLFWVVVFGGLAALLGAFATTNH